MVRTKKSKFVPGRRFPGERVAERDRLKSQKQPGKIQKRKTPKANAKTQAPKPTIPFDPSDNILLVGEGDFSFTISLLLTHHCTNLTATAYDSKETFTEKYHPQGPENATHLEEAEQNVYFAIDATKLATYKVIGAGAPYDVVMFNFPHVGGLSTDVNRQVRSNQELIVKFFNAVVSGNLIQKDTGRVVMTLFEGEPYTLWNVKDLARHEGLFVERSFKFVAKDVYPEYRHARTLGNLDGEGWKGEEREARSYVFGIKEDPNAGDGQAVR